jgi:hypothetical protein
MSAGSRDLRERKAWMEARAMHLWPYPAAWYAEELFEIHTLRSFRAYQTVVLLNSHSFFEPLLALFEQSVQTERFAKPYRISIM